MTGPTIASLRLAAASLGLTAAVAAQGGVTWSQVNVSPRPPQRRSHVMVSDLARQHIVLFGGIDTAWMSDTWEWDGTQWHQRSPATSPAARYNHGLAYDEARQKTVLFGGNTWGIGVAGDTWEWDGVNWTQRFPANSPPVRWVINQSMAYHATAQHVVLFGGRSGGSGTYVHGTWLWDGTNWSAHVGTSPPPRESTMLAYDRARERIVMFGGYDGTLLTDTWEWDGNSWTFRGNTPALSNFPHGVAYDENRQRVVLWLSGQTWEWDGNIWTQLTPQQAPSQRIPAMAYDHVNGNVLMFSGGYPTTDEMWRYESLAPAGSQDLGGGCTGSGGANVLVATTQPWTNATFHATATGLAANTAAVGIFGASPISVPLASGHPLGVAGCDLLVTDDILIEFLPAGGSVATSIAIPNANSLIGVDFYHQVVPVALDAAGHITALTSTNALQLTIGAL